MAVRIQFRRGTAAEWVTANPTLAAGEAGYETDTAKFKLGDGSSAWDALAYAGVNQSDIEAAVASVVDFAPETLDTLVELADAINNDPDVFNTLSTQITTSESNLIAYADGVESNVRVYADTAAANAESNAIAYANIVESNAMAHTNTAVANLVSSAPGTLDTLSELATALGEDPNFATTVSTTLGTKLAFIADTDANFLSANAVTDANTAYILLGQLGHVKIGDGTTVYGDMPLISQDLITDGIEGHNSLDENIHGISNTQNLVYQIDLTSTEDILQNSINDVSNTLSNSNNTINSISSSVTGLDGRVVTLENESVSVDGRVNNLENTVTSIEDTITTTLAPLSGAVLISPTISGASLEGTTTLESDATVGGANSAELGHLSGVTSGIQAQIDTKSDIDSPSFTGAVVLPVTTTIGNVVGTEISALENVSSNIQSQLDAKLATASAASIYAPLSGPTFTGTVSLPATTSIGDVSAAELGHVNGVTSGIQGQLDVKAPLESPTFTGTVSGVTSSMVGLSNVDNTSDADKVVSTATQAALDAKLNLAGGIMTGKITLDGDPTQALHAVTKQYADSISEGLHIHAAVVALSDSNIDLTGAAPTTVIDGVTLADGDRVIINGQTAPAENGIYVYTLAGSVFNRAEDFDEPGEVSGGDFVFVTGGTDYENTGWVKTSDSVAVIGTDAINFTQFSGAGTVTAGSNIDVTGTQVSVVAAPIFTDKVTLSANGIQFADGTIQTGAGVPSLTSFTEKTAGYTLDTVDHQDNVVEMNSASAITFTIPTNATLAWPVGASMDIFQMGAGQVTIANAAGVTLNFTPGNKLRTQFSSCTIMKRGTDSWVLYGDLTA